MKNNKSIQLLTLALFILWLGMVGGCGGGSSSNSGGGAGSQNVESHGQVTINLLEHNVFTGDKLNENFWGWLEAYCKAGPTQLIIADMPLVFEHFNRSIAPGFWQLQAFVLASTYRGVGWGPLGDEESEYYYSIQDQIFNWWDRYIMRIVDIMNKAPQTTVVIIINDFPDACGARLGTAIQERLESFGNRVVLGDVLWDYVKIKSR
jgi:hypothetical protein